MTIAESIKILSDERKETETAIKEMKTPSKRLKEWAESLDMAISALSATEDIKADIDKHISGKEQK